MARDGANILEKPYSEAVYRLDKFIENRISVKFGGKAYGYKVSDSSLIFGWYSISLKSVVWNFEFGVWTFQHSQL